MMYQEPFLLLRSFTLCINSSFVMGLAFLSSLSHNLSLSGPKKGLEKLSGRLIFLVLDIVKYTKVSDFGKGTNVVLKNYFEEKILKIRSRLAGFASKVTYFPELSTVITTLNPLHLLVRPVNLNIGNSKPSLSSSQCVCSHSITSSSSFGERMPSLCSSIRLSCEWSYSMFMLDYYRISKEPEENQFLREIQRIRLSLTNNVHHKFSIPKISVVNLIKN